jgi:hypothetical protein
MGQGQLVDCWPEAAAAAALLCALQPAAAAAARSKAINKAATARVGLPQQSLRIQHSSCINSSKHSNS